MTFLARKLVILAANDPRLGPLAYAEPVHPHNATVGSFGMPLLTQPHDSHTQKGLKTQLLNVRGVRKQCK